MARRPVSPSARSRKPRSRDEKREVQPAIDVRGWLGGIRLSGFAVIMLGLVVLGAFVLVPTIGTYAAQRAQVEALEHAVSVAKEDVANLKAEQERWKDPNYIMTQARERLYYVEPGQVIYLVYNDLDESTLPQEQEDVSEDVVETKSDWMAQTLRNITSAGLSQTVVGAPLDGGTGEQTPSPTESTPPAQ